MKKIMLLLAAMAIATSSLSAQVTTEPVGTATVEEPDRVQMRALSKDPTGTDIVTSNQLKEVKKCDKVEGKKCQKAEGKTCDKAEGQKCQKAEGKKCDKAEGHKCQKAEGKTCEKAEGQKCQKDAAHADCHKAGEACTKPADQKCEKCKQAEIEAKTVQTSRGPVCRMQPNNGEGKEASIKDANEAKQEQEPQLVPLKKLNK